MSKLFAAEDFRLVTHVSHQLRSSGLISMDERILIQHLDTGCYLTSPDHWTPNPFEGQKFFRVMDAISYVQILEIPDVHIVFYSGSQKRCILTLNPWSKVFSSF